MYGVGGGEFGESEGVLGESLWRVRGCLVRVCEEVRGACQSQCLLEPVLASARVAGADWRRLMRMMNGW